MERLLLAGIQCAIDTELPLSGKFTNVRRLQELIKETPVHQMLNLLTSHPIIISRPPIEPYVIGENLFHQALLFRLLEPHAPASPSKSDSPAKRDNTRYHKLELVAGHPPSVHNLIFCEAVVIITDSQGQRKLTPTQTLLQIGYNNSENVTLLEADEKYIIQLRIKKNVLHTWTIRESETTPGIYACFLAEPQKTFKPTRKISS